MRFEQALQHLLEGKKIKRKIWYTGEYIFIDDFDEIVEDNNDPYAIDLDDINYEGWELYTDPQEEKQHQWRATHNSLLELHKCVAQLEDFNSRQNDRNVRDHQRIKALEVSVQVIMSKLDL